jgi:hypothetical protein
MRFILLLLCLLLFSCSTTTIVDEENNKKENLVLEVETEYEENIECEDDSIPCEVLSLWALESFDEDEFEEAINNANQAIACNCSVSNAGEIYSGLARAYSALDEDIDASNAIKKGLSYDPENIELIELAVWNSNKLDNIDDEISNLELLLSVDESIDNF